MTHEHTHTKTVEKHIDPVCGMTVDPATNKGGAYEHACLDTGKDFLLAYHAIGHVRPASARCARTLGCTCACASAGASLIFLAGWASRWAPCNYPNLRKVTSAVSESSTMVQGSGNTRLAMPEKLTDIRKTNNSKVTRRTNPYTTRLGHTQPAASFGPCTTLPR